MKRVGLINLPGPLGFVGDFLVNVAKTRPVDNHHGAVVRKAQAHPLARERLIPVVPREVENDRQSGVPPLQFLLEPDYHALNSGPGLVHDMRPVELLDDIVVHAGELHPEEEEQCVARADVPRILDGRGRLRSGMFARRIRHGS